MIIKNRAAWRRRLGYSGLRTMLGDSETYLNETQLTAACQHNDECFIFVTLSAVVEKGFMG